MGIITAETYLTSIATRAVIFIEADNPYIGTVASVGVGMAEVLTCDITVKEGQHVKKGEQLGMFHYGGSTHFLLFENGVNVTGFPEKGGEWNVPVRGVGCCSIIWFLLFEHSLYIIYPCNNVRRMIVVKPCRSSKLYTDAESA